MSKITFALAYPDREGRGCLRHVGQVVIGKAGGQGRDDSALCLGRDMKFEIGDYLVVGVFEASREGSGHAGRR